MLEVILDTVVKVGSIFGNKLTTNQKKIVNGYSGENCHRFRLNPATFRTS
ncbi:MAG: hypothetical protein HOD17_14035 [Desulfobacteraceae bacterium]|nr:hypothetical protein [Desulfobacteraceae bacterium]